MHSGIAWQLVWGQLGAVKRCACVHVGVSQIGGIRHLNPQNQVYPHGLLGGLGPPL